MKKNFIHTITYLHYYHRHKFYNMTFFTLSFPGQMYIYQQYVRTVLTDSTIFILVLSF